MDLKVRVLFDGLKAGVKFNITSVSTNEKNSNKTTTERGLAFGEGISTIQSNSMVTELHSGISVQSWSRFPIHAKALG